MKGLLDKKKAADFLEISVSTLNRYLTERRLRSIKFKGRVFFEIKDLEAYKRSMYEVRSA